MNTKIPLAPAELMALVNEAEHPAQARHVAGQAVMGNKKIQLMMSLAVQVDERGLDAAIASLVVSARYPKGKLA